MARAKHSHQLHVMLGTLYKKSFEAGSMCGDVCAVEFVLIRD